MVKLKITFYKFYKLSLLSTNVPDDVACWMTEFDGMIYLFILSFLMWENVIFSLLKINLH